MSSSTTTTTLSPCSFPIRIIASNLLYRFSNAHLVCCQLRVLIFVSFPSFYLLLYKSPSFLVLVLVFIVVFSATLLLSISSGLPWFPPRSQGYRVKSSPLPVRDSKPVVWSIGSKPKSENRPESGSWVEVYSNGDVYEGGFNKGKCSGSGVYSYYMSGRYEGDWVDGEYAGYGVETWARGSRYRGQYRQGLRHGVGVYRFYTGDVYAGEWSNGQCHGSGTYSCQDGSKYVGEFKWGVKHGLGYYHFRNGDSYAGEYFADKMHGFGVYTFGNGHRYEGAWHEGRRQGLGTYTFRNGEAQSGHWQNGFLDVHCVEDKQPGSPHAISLSKVCKAVQDAQRAAENAQRVAKVDGRVHMSIASANKSANAARVAAIKAVQNQMHQNYNNELITHFH